MSQVTINHDLATRWMQHLALKAKLGGQNNPRRLEYIALADKIDTRTGDTLELTDREVFLTRSFKPVKKLIQE